MKAESTIRKQIARIVRVCNASEDKDLRAEAYEAYHALRWVVEGTSWSPAKMFEDRLTKEKEEKP